MDDKIKTDLGSDGLNLDSKNKTVSQGGTQKLNQSNSGNTTQNVDVNSGDVVKIKVKLDDNIFSDRIALSASDAKNSKFVKESNINKDVWDSADLTITDRGDGTYAIKNGDIIIGFTDKYDTGVVTNENNSNHSNSNQSSSFDTNKLDLTRISFSEADVLNNKHVDTINENVFRNGNITVDNVGNGVYAIKNNGITIGYTDEDGISYNGSSSSDSELTTDIDQETISTGGYQFSNDAVLTGSIGGEKFNQSRVSNSKDGVINGDYSFDLLDKYQGKDLLYEVDKNGIVSIIHGDKIIGYTDVFGCSEIRNQLKEGTSPFMDYLISVDERLALDSGGNSLGSIMNEYNKDKVVDYSDINYVKGTNCGVYGSSNGTGIISTVTVGDRTYNSYCQGTGAWGSTYAGDGCAKTALSTIFSGFEEGFTPSDYMKTGGTLKDHINAKGYEYNDLNNNKTDIIEELKQGHPVMYHILNGHVPNADSGTKNYGEHWVALLGYDEKTGKVYMSEPGSTHSDGFYDLSLFSDPASAFSVYKDDDSYITPINSDVSSVVVEPSSVEAPPLESTDMNSDSTYSSTDGVYSKGSISYTDLNLSKISSTEEGAYNGDFSYSDGFTVNYEKIGNKELSYEVKNNGVVCIYSGDYIIGYTDIYGSQKIYDSLSKGNSNLMNYLIDTDIMYANDGSGKCLGKIMEGYDSYLEKIYSNHEWNASSDYSDGIYGQYVNGNMTYNVFSQNRGKYANIPLAEPSKTVSGAGCGITSLSTVLSGFGIDVNPACFKNMRSAGDEFLTGYMDDYGVEHKFISKDEIASEVSIGHPVIYHVNNGKVGSNYYSGHYVAILGYDKETDKYFLADPASPTNTGWHSIDEFTGMTSAIAVYKDDVSNIKTSVDNLSSSDVSNTSIEDVEKESVKVDSSNGFKCDDFVLNGGDQLETVYKIIAAEGGNISTDEAVNIASVMINRARKGGYPGGKDIYKIATAPNQFVVYQEGLYKNKTLSAESRTAVDELFAKCAAGGETSHNYTNFRSNNSGWYDGTVLASGGNRYGNS